MDLYIIFRLPVVKIQPSKTLVGQPVGTKVADFSSRGPNSIEPAILKVCSGFLLFCFSDILHYFATRCV